MARAKHSRPGPVLDATLARRPPVQGVGPYGCRAAFAREHARDVRARHPDSQVIRVLTAIVIEMAEDIDALVAEVADRPHPVNSFRMGVDAQGRPTIVIHWEPGAPGSPEPKQVHLGSGHLAPGYEAVDPAGGG
jgi:hypothetical protein